MKTQSRPLTLPIVGTEVSGAVEVGSGAWGFSVQLVGVAAATGAAYAVEGSIDGETWIDLTKNLVDRGPGGAVASGPISADSIFDYSFPFPGSVRVKCTTAPGSAPGTLPVATVAYQDTREV